MKLNKNNKKIRVVFVNGNITEFEYTSIEISQHFIWMKSLDDKERIIPFSQIRIVDGVNLRINIVNQHYARTMSC